MNFSNKSNCNDCRRKSKRLDLTNPFGGGTALDVIYNLDDLDGYETAVLLYIGSQTDFRDSNNIMVPTISIREISKSIKFSRRTICRALVSLVSKSYLYIENNFDEFNSQSESTYYLSEYLFKKHDNKAHSSIDEGGCLTDTGGVPSRHCYNTSVATSSDWLPDDSERSDEKINKNNEIDLIGGGSQAEGGGLSPSQTDIIPNTIGNSSPTAHIPPPPIEEEFEPVKKQFEQRIDKAKSNYGSSSYKIVTDSHRKMLAIFRPNPELKKKVFVRDNDILFFTDQILVKYGDISHKVIDLLFTDTIELGKCGQIAWDVQKAYLRVEIAYKRYMEKMKNE